MKLFVNSATDILRHLKSTGETLRAAHSKKDVFDFTIKILLELGFDRARIWMVNEEEKDYRGAKCSYMSDKKFQKAHETLGASVLPKNYVFFLKKKKPYLNKTAPILKKFFNDPIRNTIEFPLLSEKKLLGVVSVDNSISKRKIDLKNAETAIMPFMNHIASVFDRIIADEKLRETNRALEKKIKKATAELQERNSELNYLAHYDELSQLPNRRFFKKHFRKEFTKAGPQKTLTCVMLDIDFLKNVNDTRGHEAGDRLIGRIGKVLRETKGIDFAARFAGDEFAFLMFNKSRAQKHKIFKDILDRIKKATRHTASIGCATVPALEAKTPIDLIRLADDALYHAKHTGRNRFICACEEKITSFKERRLELQKIEEQGTTAVEYIHQLAAINQISEHLRTTKNERDALRKIMLVFKKELGFERSYLYTRQQEDSRELFLIASSDGKKTPKINQLTFRKGGLIEKSIFKKSVTDTHSKDKVAPSFAQNFETRNALFTPLVGRTHVIGIIISIYSPGRVFRERDREFFLTLGDQIENGITKIRATRAIQNFNQELRKEVFVSTRKLKTYAKSLEEQVTNNRELLAKEQRIHFEMISALVASLEEKDIYTRGHSVRVASYAVKLGQEVGMNKAQIENLRYAGLLHDIGKVAVDQSVLQKRSALSDNEKRELEQHPVTGEKIISRVRFLQPTAEIVRQHHEHWNGTGYPDGTKRAKILPGARILSIADAYDAMVTRRSYGRKMSRAEAIKELTIGSGKQFDPKMTKVFIRLLKQGKIYVPSSNFARK